MATINYVPFLKAKNGEIDALGALVPAVKESICPFLDYPRQTKKQTSEEFKVTSSRMLKKLSRHAQGIEELYFDNFDLDDFMKVDGEDCYKYLLETLCEFEIEVIPVVSIDRTDAHIEAVRALKSNGHLSNTTIAVRFTVNDFQSFPVVKPELDEKLATLLKLFLHVDLIFDCRQCADFDSTRIANQIDKFSIDFANNYEVRRRVIGGSSIPGSISEICAVGETVNLVRTELDIYRQLSQANIDSIFGDYGIVSPNYSDVDLPPEMLGNIMTAKVIYAYDGYHHIIRGRGLQAHGYEQYFQMLTQLCTSSFFRGEGYSLGDRYFSERSGGQGTNCTPSSIIKPSVNSHITYMVQDSPI